MRRWIVAALALALLVTGCSDDGGDDDPKGGSDKASAVSPDDFCAAFDKNDGSETAIRPVPASQTKAIIQGTVDRAQAAMKDITPPEPIERQWTALSEHYESVAGEVDQLKPNEKLPPKQQRTLQKQTDRAFDDSGRAVVNFVLQHCL